MGGDNMVDDVARQHHLETRLMNEIADHEVIRKILAARLISANVRRWNLCAAR